MEWNRIQKRPPLVCEHSARERWPYVSEEGPVQSVAFGQLGVHLETMNLSQRFSLNYEGTKVLDKRWFLFFQNIGIET